MAEKVERVDSFLIVIQIIFDMLAGHRAVTAIKVRSLLADLLNDRTSNLIGEFESLRLNAVSTIVARASFDILNVGLFNKLENLFRFWADVLHALVAGHVIAHVTEGVLELSIELPSLV